MQIIHDTLVKSGPAVAIAGHVNPDGDCVGSCVGLSLYIQKNYPDKHVTVYLEQPKESLLFLKGTDQLVHQLPEGADADLLILCDVSSVDRIGVAGDLLDRAAHTLCIDHHVSNPGFAEKNWVEPDASSCAEVLCGLLEFERMDRDIASALYTGIIHDSGVFQYANTSPRTMRIAARLMEFGVPFQKIIEESFYQRTYCQNRVLGHVLDEMERLEDGRVVFSSISILEQVRYEVQLKDLDPIVSQLRLTAGAEAAVFLYETDPGRWKVSLRSSSMLDVAKIATAFGGGGHVRAAGCTIEGRYDEARERILSAVCSALREASRA